MQFFKGHKKLKMAISGIIMAYIFGQGMADWAKEGKK